MKIAKIEDLHADAGWRTFSFLKITTDDGLIGWSEYTEGDGSRGLTGGDPRVGGAADRAGPAPGAVHRLGAVCRARCRRRRASTAAPSPRSSWRLLDIKGKALGVPCYELFGGPVRERIPVYWSHCGSYRVRNGELARHAAAAHLRRCCGTRRRGEAARLQGAEDQRAADAGRTADQLPARLRPHPGFPGAERRSRARCGRSTTCWLRSAPARGRRSGCIWT